MVGIGAGLCLGRICYGALRAQRAERVVCCEIRERHPWAQQLVSEPSSSHRSDFGGERKPISKSDPIRSAQKWRLSIPPDSSRRDEAPAPNRVKIGRRMSPHAPPEVRRKSLISTEKPFLSFLGIPDSSTRITPYGKSRMKDTEGDEQEDDWADQTMHWTRGHDETSAHGLWTKLKEMYREKTSQNKVLLRRLVLKLQRGTTVAEQTSEFQRATGRGQKEEAREEVSRRRSQRRDKKNCPRNKVQDQSSEAATTAMMAVDESDVLLAASADEETVRFRMADGRSMKVTGVRHVSLRCRSRSDEALKLVEEHSEVFQGKQEKLQEKEDWKAIPTEGECPDRRAAVRHRSSGISKMNGRKKQLLHRGTQSKRRKVWPDTRRCNQCRMSMKQAQRKKTESMHNDRRDVAETSLFRSRYVMVISLVVHTREERWSHDDDLQSDVLCSAPRWGGAGHLSEKVQALRLSERGRGAEQKCNPWGITESTQLVAVCRGAGLCLGRICYGALRAQRAERVVCCEIRERHPWAQQLVSEPSSSHRSDFGGERKPISKSDPIRSAQKWRLSIPPDSSRRDEAPAPNRVKIGRRMSPHAPPEVRRSDFDGKAFLSFLGIPDSSTRITPYGKSRMKDTEGDEQEDDWADQTMHWTRGHDETSAHGLWTKLKEMYREKTSQNKVLLRRLVLKLQRGTTVAEQTSEFQRATGRGQKEEAREEVSRRRSQRFRRRGGTRRIVQGTKYKISLQRQQQQAMMAVDESDVLLAASADEESDWISDSGIAYHLSRSDEALKLVEEHSEVFQGKQGSCRRRKTGRLYRLRENVQTGELLSDIDPVARCRRNESLSLEIRDGDLSSCAHKGQRWSHDDLSDECKRLLAAHPVGGAGHLSEKVQALRFGNAFTSVGSGVAR
ncbi:hypothetical protein Acr_20g0010610 [Actinidia rufa]|uniref:Uncharacterized protein n=1 Tax=Actinidia rufa TaxID=165716 RepID=A0A7J0GEM1_9ERIC|nr:hypothetical protein Acr_20g0010610 [Actinidia rufa]